MTFIDANDLHIETDDSGFILGTSVLGDVLGSETTVWLERRTQFSSLNMTRSVSVEKGILFRPETATLSLRMPGDGLKSGAFGKRIRVRWKDDVIFTGEIKSTGYSSEATNDGAKTYMTIQAVGITERFNRLVLFNLERPEETAGVRANAAVPVFNDGTSVEVIDCNRLMATRGNSTVKLMTVLQETSDAQLARFYVNKHNVLTMDGNAAPEPVIMFSDDPAQEDRCDYHAVDMAEQLDNTITAVGVTAKQDDSLTASAFATTAIVTHEETYSVDLPLRQNELDAWAQSFPLLGFTRLEPATLTCQWQEQLSGLELTELVSIQKDGVVYRSGVKAIDYTIVPTRDGGLTWGVSLDLMPGHLVEFSSLIAPSDPQAFSAVATSDHSVALTWTAPGLPNDMTGYEIRYAEGPTPPATRLDGTLLAAPDASATTYTHTEASSSQQYSYAIWAVTENPLIVSNRVTASASTPETIPSAPTGLSAAKNSATQHTLSWSAPAAPGDDVTGYELRYRTDGTNPTATTGTLKTSLAYGTTSYVASGLTRNRTYRWGLFPKTAAGAYGPGVFASQNTNETVPTAVSGLSSNAPNYQHLDVWWGHSSSRTDFDHYHVEYLVNRGGPPTSPGSGNYWTDTTGTGVSADGMQMNSWYDVSVWPVTKGGLYGARASTAAFTPQGIFSKVYDGGVAWTQSYKWDNQFSSLGSGNNNNLYYGYGDSYNNVQRSMAGWNLPGDLVNCYSIDRVVLNVYNLHTWLNSGADCWFGVHNATGKPGTFFQTAGGLAVYHMSKPGWLSVDVTAWLGPQLRAGAKGITLGPPPNSSTNYYGYAAGTPGPVPTLHIEYRTIGG